MESYARDLFAYKQVLVTGGTSGIGLSTALAFRNLGATVTATTRTEEEAVRARDDPAHEGIKFAALDVRDGRAIKAAIAWFRQLDVVVNAVGVVRRDSDRDPEVFADVVTINLIGIMRICAAAKPKLVNAKGAIINIASMQTYAGGRRDPGFTTAKGCIGQLTKSLAAAWAPEGIRVNAVAPGWIAPPAGDAPVAGAGGQPGAGGAAATPMGRWGTPEEVAGGVIFLASPAARFITGAILAIDGGFLAA
jgi:NAD(P)-dependent dehydrogenase (short-subunit alcohol dehydrogenase family)